MSNTDNLERLAAFTDSFVEAQQNENWEKLAELQPQLQERVELASAIFAIGQSADNAAQQRYTELLEQLQQSVQKAAEQAADARESTANQLKQLAAGKVAAGKYQAQMEAR